MAVETQYKTADGTVFSKRSDALAHEYSGSAATEALLLIAAANATDSSEADKAFVQRRASIIASVIEAGGYDLVAKA